MPFDRALGFDDYWRAHLQVASLNAGVELCAARVVAVHRGVVSTLDLAGVERGHRLATPGHCTDSELWPPVVGDWVGVQGERIAAILTRRTFLSRPSASRRSVSQAIAANIDIVAIAEPVRPAPAVGRVERFTALALAGGCCSWLIITKTDLEDAARVAELERELGAGCDEVFAISNQEAASLEPLRASLAGQTIVLVGRSGAGKSTLLNALAEPEAPSGPEAGTGTGPETTFGSLAGPHMNTAAVRPGDMKGRHTTTSRQLVVTGSAAIIDTPGIRALGATEQADAVDQAFADITALAEACHFTDCTHTSEPGCAVRAAVDEGLLDADRVERFHTMIDESQRRARRRNARLARADERRASKDNTSGRRQAMRHKGRHN
ncbi:MAG: GTPase RsgA [Actinomycetaceae bacterium]|nr:GTPase RsgA [Actinomycetaceae bacterium]